MNRRWNAYLCAAAVLLAGLSAHAQLRTRDNQNPQTYPPAVATNPNVIASGTTFLATLDTKLETKKLDRGKHFKLKLAEDLIAPNGAVIPRGKKIEGHVSDFERGFHGRVLLSVDKIETQHGWVPLIATVIGAPGDRGLKSDSEGDIQRAGMNKRRTVETAAVGAVVGAVAGGAAAGGHGAAIGAAVGAGAGAAAGILTDRDMKLDKGTNLELRLDRNLQVPTH